MQRWNNFIYYFIFRQVALKALNERLTKAEGQSNWPTLLDDEGKTESTGKEGNQFRINQCQNNLH
jgi:hypothetical protein